MGALALRSLAHDRVKLLASLAGVALATTLLLVQIGLFVGFQHTSSELIRRLGGDLWIVGKGLEVVDNGPPLSRAARAALDTDPCVSRVRGVVLQVAPYHEPSGALTYVQLVGVEPSARALIPWSMERGLPQDLSQPMALAVDEHDRGALSLPLNPLGATLSLGASRARVVALTREIRSFSLLPYVFTSLPSARRLLGLPGEEVTYWVADLAHQECLPTLAARVQQQPGVEALSTRALADRTEDYWVWGSGAGAAIGFSALFSLFVGSVIVGQTLFSITKEHLRELATLKAMGARPLELARFIAWQAGALAVVGGLVGAALAWAIQGAISSQGIALSLAPPVWLLATLAVTVMCALASVPSFLTVSRLDAAEVFR